MEGYLGEFDVDLTSTEFADYTPNDWAMYWITRYGQISGDHHKAWVIDQIARILKGTKVILKQARWQNGHSEYRITLDEPAQNYQQWVEQMLGEFDTIFEEHEYAYDYGIAP